MRTIEIEIIGKGKALAKLDERNPKIREAFFKALPMEGIANLWGEEVYFDVPLQMDNENPSPSAAAGDICYWSPGPAFCIFFGKTQPYSSVNHIGKGHTGAGDIQERGRRRPDSAEEKVSDCHSLSVLCAHCDLCGENRRAHGIKWILLPTQSTQSLQSTHKDYAECFEIA